MRREIPRRKTCLGMAKICFFSSHFRPVGVPNEFPGWMFWPATEVRARREIAGCLTLCGFSKGTVLRRSFGTRTMGSQKTRTLTKSGRVRHPLEFVRQQVAHTQPWTSVLARLPGELRVRRETNSAHRKARRHAGHLRPVCFCGGVRAERSGPQISARSRVQEPGRCAENFPGSSIRSWPIVSV